MSKTTLTQIEAFAHLYNNAKAQGMGFLHYDPTHLSPQDAEVALKDYPRGRDGAMYFDYYKGRVMKIWIPEGDVDPIDLDYRLYDRDNGADSGIDCLAKAME